VKGSLADARTAFDAVDARKTDFDQWAVQTQVTAQVLWNPAHAGWV
jgi:hypothetical protein